MADSVHSGVDHRVALVVVIVAGLVGVLSTSLSPAGFVNNVFLLITAVVIAQLSMNFKKTVGFCRVLVLTAYRDVKCLGYLIYFKLSTNKWMIRHRKNPARLLEDTAKSHPFKTALIQAETGRRWNFQELNEYANQIANIFKETGLKPGDSVALICDNRLEYGAIWIGLNRCGLVPALINYKLQDEALKHCLTIVDSKAVIVLSELLHNVVALDLPKSVKVYEFEGSDDLPSPRSSSLSNQDLPNIQSVNTLVANACALPPTTGFHIPASTHDTAFYIYTSGTTGMPKAAKISTTRFCMMTYLPFGIYGLSRNEIFYCSLPLYHSNGGIVVFGQLITRGVTVVLRKKFSASRHWEDCIKYRATGFNYIGEICRFLLAQKQSVGDVNHCVRFIVGNGLKPEIWRVFVDRFGIKQVCEFYGATEGVANLINPSSKEGACGFITRIAPSLYPVCVIRVDQETSEPIRDPATGKCVQASANETGMLVGKIEKTGVSRFDGYQNKEQSKKKIVRNVFNKDDEFFLTGDLVAADELGWVRFQDRTGDTFRWKGENCSTAEVEATASRVLNNHNLALACVSTEIPGNDGKAGLLCIDRSKSEVPIDVDGLYKGMSASLPAYAVPVVVRLTQNIELTGSFKIQKAKVRKLGYDIGQLPGDDDVYILQKGAYKLLDKELYSAMMNKELRF